MCGCPPVTHTQTCSCCQFLVLGIQAGLGDWCRASSLTWTNRDVKRALGERQVTREAHLVMVLKPSQNFTDQQLPRLPQKLLSGDGKSRPARGIIPLSPNRPVLLQALLQKASGIRPLPTVSVLSLSQPRPVSTARGAQALVSWPLASRPQPVLSTAQQSDLSC